MRSHAQMQKCPHPKCNPPSSPSPLQNTNVGSESAAASKSKPEKSLTGAKPGQAAGSGSFVISSRPTERQMKTDCGSDVRQGWQSGTKRSAAIMEEGAEFQFKSKSRGKNKLYRNFPTIGNRELLEKLAAIFMHCVLIDDQQKKKGAESENSAALQWNHISERLQTGWTGLFLLSYFLSLALAPKTLSCNHFVRTHSGH